MIDEKKIIQATNDELKSVQVDYMDDDGFGVLYPTEQREMDSLIRDVFADGIYWAISQFKKSLWHDAKEEPKKGETCLVYARFTYEDKEPIEDYFTSTYTTYGWTEDWFPNDYDGEVKRWCYINDLLPQEGGEQ